MALLAVSCGEPVPTAAPSARPTASPTSTTSPTARVEFDGTIHGWRLAPHEVLEKEFGNDIRNLDLECDPKQVKDSTKTDLDIKLTYLPDGWSIEGKPGVVKWACPDLALSTFYEYGLTSSSNPGPQYIRLDRVREGRRALALYAPADGVEECTIRGLPAICVRYDEPIPRFTFIVIEDDTLDPFVSHLLLDADGPISYEELVKLLEGLE